MTTTIFRIKSKLVAEIVAYFLLLGVRVKQNNNLLGIKSYLVAEIVVYFLLVSVRVKHNNNFLD